jgi:uncharacterized lipoprotein YajG
MKKLIILVLMTMSFAMCSKQEAPKPIQPNWLAYVGFNQVQNTPFFAQLNTDSINNNQYFILVAQDSIPNSWGLLVGQPNNIVKLTTVHSEQELQQWYNKLTGKELKLPE